MKVLQERGVWGKIAALFSLETFQFYRTLPLEDSIKRLQKWFNRTYFSRFWHCHVCNAPIPSINFVFQENSIRRSQIGRTMGGITKYHTRSRQTRAKLPGLKNTSQIHDHFTTVLCKVLLCRISSNLSHSLKTISLELRQSWRIPKRSWDFHKENHGSLIVETV